MLEVISEPTCREMPASPAVCFYLRGHLKEKVEAEKKERNVRGPSGKERRQLAHTTHGFEQTRGGPVDNPYSDA